MRPLPVRTQVLLVNAALLAGSGAAALGAPEPLVPLAAGLLLTGGANVVLVRRRLHGFERLAARLEAGERAPGAPPAAPATPVRAGEVERVGRALDGLLARLERERRHAGQAVLRAQERERRRVSRELHDEVNQALAAILLRLEALAQDAPPSLRAAVEELRALAGRAMDELLALARDLRPAALDDLGLVSALHSLVGDFRRRTGIAATFACRGPLRPLSDDEQLVLYRAAQESLSNVAQHAGAGRVEVELSFVGQTVLRVADDGRGFAPREVGPAGLGLSGMRERARLVQGALALHSRPGRGTVVELVLP